MRMFVETQLAPAAGINVEWEVDGIPAIVDLVARGFGHAVLSMNAIRDHPLRAAAAAATDRQAKLAIILALVTSSQRPMTPLAEQVARSRGGPHGAPEPSSRRLNTTVAA